MTVLLGSLYVSSGPTQATNWPRALKITKSSAVSLLNRVFKAKRTQIYHYKRNTNIPT